MTDSPKRIRLSREKGYRKPPGAIVVSRPSKYGNPYPVERYGLSRSRTLFRRHLASHPTLVETARRELAGRDLACYCPLDATWCHAMDWIAIAAGATLPLDAP